MKKVITDWYKNKTWNGTIDTYFEENLKRTRNASNKADYLQIQGVYLLNNQQPAIQEVGINLLQRLLDDFKAEHQSIVIAQEKLGDYYLQKQHYKDAAAFFTAVNNYCTEQKSRSGTSTMADLKLAEALLQMDESVNMDRAYQLITGYPVELLQSNDHKFYYHQLAARVCCKQDKKEEAKKFAAAAIEISKLIRTVSTNTIIKKSGHTLQSIKTMEEIVLG